MPHFDTIKIYIAVGNIVRKGEIANNKQFHLFSQYFLRYMAHIFHFTCTLKCCLQFSNLDKSKILSSGNGLKVALQILERKFYKNTKKSSQSLLIFIHRTPVVERHQITREIRDLLWPMSTPTQNTIYLYMSNSFIYTLKIHRRSFNHSVR